MAAFAVGAAQLALPKGSVRHRLIGWSWVMLTLTVALTSFFIHTIRMWGVWSPIHLLSIVVLVNLPLAAWHGHHITGSPAIAWQ